MVLADGVTITDIQGATILLLAAGQDEEEIDVAELDLREQRVVNLAHLRL
jgi:hypothetical protein